MIVPPAEIIEGVADNFILVKQDTLFLHQANELCSLGSARMKKIGVNILTADFILGYEFGLQVARAMVANSAAVAVANVDPKNVL